MGLRKPAGRGLATFSEMEIAEAEGLMSGFVVFLT